MKMRKRRWKKKERSIYTHSKRSFEHKLNVGRLTMASKQERERRRKHKKRELKIFPLFHCLLTRHHHPPSLFSSIQLTQFRTP
jgi:hypothetical protein